MRYELIKKHTHHSIIISVQTTGAKKPRTFYRTLIPIFPWAGNAIVWHALVVRKNEHRGTRRDEQGAAVRKVANVMSLQRILASVAAAACL